MRIIEIVWLVASSLFLIAGIILLVAFGLKLLWQMIQVDSLAYIDDETEDYINSPNRWD